MIAPKTPAIWATVSKTVMNKVDRVDQRLKEVVDDTKKVRIPPVAGIQLHAAYKFLSKMFCTTGGAKMYYYLIGTQNQDSIEFLASWFFVCRKILYNTF